LVVSAPGSTPTPFGFAGQHGYQSDSETGLMRLGHRYYDSSTGRFISRDPIWDGYNWYTYCNNDPINKIDPEGTDPPEEKKPIKIEVVGDKALVTYDDGSKEVISWNPGGGDGKIKVSP
jgi:RHS repeat-associated protein